MWVFLTRTSYSLTYNQEVSDLDNKINTIKCRSPKRQLPRSLSFGPVSDSESSNRISTAVAIPRPDEVVSTRLARLAVVPLSDEASEPPFGVHKEDEYNSLAIGVSRRFDGVSVVDRTRVVLAR